MTTASSHWLVKAAVAAGGSRAIKGFHKVLVGDANDLLLLFVIDRSQRYLACNHRSRIDLSDPRGVSPLNLFFRFTLKTDTYNFKNKSGL
jgi:hypothetical protein